MKQIPDQTFRDLARILPILARVADTSADSKVSNAGRMARKYGKKFNQQTKSK